MPTDLDTFTRAEAIEYFRQLDSVYRADYCQESSEDASQYAVTLQAFAALGVTPNDIAAPELTRAADNADRYRGAR